MAPFCRLPCCPVGLYSKIKFNKQEKGQACFAQGRPANNHPPSDEHEARNKKHAQRNSSFQMPPFLGSRCPFLRSRLRQRRRSAAGGGPAGPHAGAVGLRARPTVPAMGWALHEGAGLLEPRHAFDVDVVGSLERSPAC